MNRESFETHRAYIASNPVKAGLAASADEYPFCFRFLARKKIELARQAEISSRAKAPIVIGRFFGTAKAVPLLQNKLESSDARGDSITGASRRERAR